LNFDIWSLLIGIGGGAIVGVIVGIIIKKISSERQLGSARTQARKISF